MILFFRGFEVIHFLVFLLILYLIAIIARLTVLVYIITSCIFLGIFIFLVSRRMKKTYAIYTGKSVRDSWHKGAGTTVTLTKNFSGTGYIGSVSYDSGYETTWLSENFLLSNNRYKSFSKISEYSCSSDETHEKKYGVLKYSGDKHWFDEDFNETIIKDKFSKGNFLLQQNTIFLN